MIDVWWLRTAKWWCLTFRRVIFLGHIWCVRTRVYWRRSGCVSRSERESIGEGAVVCQDQNESLLEERLCVRVGSEWESIREGAVVCQNQNESLLEKERLCVRVGLVEDEASSSCLTGVSSMLVTSASWKIYKIKKFSLITVFHNISMLYIK